MNKVLLIERIEAVPYTIAQGMEMIPRDDVLKIVRESV